MKRWLGVALLAMSLHAQASACLRPNSAGDRAVIVGIGNYTSGENLRLAGPAEDRRAIRELLQTELGFHANSICELADAQATAANIQAAFENWLIAGTGKGNRAFFYFSGHGARKSLSVDPDESEGLDELLVAADVIMNGRTPASGFIADNQIKLWLDQLADRQTTLVIDSCYAGTIYRSLGLPTAHALARSVNLHPSQEAPKARSRSVSESGMLATLTRSSNPGLTVWMASGEGELAFDAPIDNPSHGQFTRAWIHQVKANVSLSEAHNALRKEATRYCESLGQPLCISLVPQLYTDGQNLARTFKESQQADARLVPEAVQASIASLPNAAISVSAVLRNVASRKVLNENTSGHVGSQVRLETSSDRSGYLHRFVLESGRLKRLCPVDPNGKLQCAPEIAAGATRREQFRLTASGPALLVVVVTAQPFSEQTERKTRGISITMEDGTSIKTDESVNGESQSQVAFTALTQELLQQALPQADLAPQHFGVATVRFHIEE